ncbi:dicarboxylate/amino acid:cation symporter [Spirochaeta lutea]|uniref:Sodium:dicarboxylate symporter n=1 Tax=Spirochaeta lutea TaxID=1480694 RepID=A0A098R0I2_9SPIO|nr:dicarboxylate/amino acid:cation symporter [Spirochaeta lutea]KGE73193.1 sodium:dicarboxylate symporter [Spirochaeta lutea]
MDTTVLLWLAGFVLLLVGLGLLKRFTSLSFSVRVFIAMLAGMALGLGVFAGVSEETGGELRRWFSLVGYGYVDLLRMLIIPLVPTSIIAGFLKLENTRELKQLGTRTLGLFLITATIASLIGIILASILGIGAGAVTEGLAPREETSIGSIFQQFRSFIPSNPVEAAAETRLIPLVVFSVLLGVAAVIEQGRKPERVAAFREVISSVLHVVIRLTKLVISLTPFGVLGLMAYWMSNTGLSALPDLGLFVLGIVIACALQIGLVYGGLLGGVARINPWRFYRAASPAMLLAFTSRSSAGTLTLTINTMINRLKVSSRVSNFVGPIGAVMNMDACGGIYPAMVSIFAANAFGIDLSLIQYVLIVVVSILASIGSAAVPMGATAFTVITLSAVGLPVEAIGLVAGVDFLVDMFRTATNVTGDLTTSVIVGNSLGEFDREAFNSQVFTDSSEEPQTAESP